MTSKNDPAPSEVFREWDPFAAATRVRTPSPFAGIPDSERLDPDHPLIKLVDRAVTVAGLSDGVWNALKAKPIDGYGKVISSARRAFNQHRRDHGLPVDAAVVARIRDRAVADLTRLVPPHQRRADGELGRVMDVIATQPPRPGTGAGAFRRALRAQTKDNA